MAKKTTEHGGAREGAGRPPKAPGERLSAVFSFRLTEEEKELLDATDAKWWAREALVKAARKKR